MRKIKIEKWKSKVPIYEDGKVVGTEEKDESLLDALNVLISVKKPEEMPRGLDKFRTFGRIVKAFDKVEKSGILELEETDYSFLKVCVEKDTPANWGFNPNILKAIEDFLEAKSEESK